MTEWTTKGKLPTKADELRSLIQDAQRKGFNWRPANADVLAALDAAEAQGARAMGEVVEQLNSLSDAAVATYQEHRSEYSDGLADGSVEAWQAVRKLAERD